jgi:hypothetical protein
MVRYWIQKHQTDGTCNTTHGRNMICLKVWSKNLKRNGKCETSCSCAEHMKENIDASEKPLCMQGCPLHEGFRSRSGNVWGTNSVLQGLLVKLLNL